MLYFTGNRNKADDKERMTGLKFMRDKDMMQFKYVRIQGKELARNTMYAKGVFILKADKTL